MSTEENDRIGFHKKFIQTQQTAQRFANKFNKVVKERLAVQRFERARVWEVTFVDCSVYSFYRQDPDGDPSERSQYGVLAEKFLEGHYIKWNGNNGYVAGASTEPDGERQARAKEMMEVSFRISLLPGTSRIRPEKHRH